MEQLEDATIVDPVTLRMLENRFAALGLQPKLCTVAAYEALGIRGAALGLVMDMPRNTASVYRCRVAKALCIDTAALAAYCHTVYVDVMRKRAHVNAQTPTT